MNIEKIVNEHLTEKCRKITTLSGGVTNESYLVETDENKYVFRVAGEGTNEYIDRENEIKNILAVNQLGIIPKVYYSDEKGTIISKYIENAKVVTKSDLLISNNLTFINKILINLHRSSICFKDEFDIQLKLKKYETVLSKIDYVYPTEFSDNLPLLKKSFDILTSKFDKQLVPCHIDPKLSNFLFTEDKVYLIDWEYSGMADEYFELANFTLTNELDEEEEKNFLNNYINNSCMNFCNEKYILYKIATDYLWIYWHFIKLEHKKNIEYNKHKWRERLYRALENIKIWEELIK